MKRFHRRDFTRQPQRGHYAALRMPATSSVLVGAAAGATVAATTKLAPPPPTDAVNLQSCPQSFFPPTGRSIHDIHQGKIADCYFLAAVGAVVFSQPDLVPQMAAAIDAAHGEFTYYAPGAFPGTFNRTLVDVDNRIEADNAQAITSAYVPMWEKSYIPIRNGGNGPNTFAALGWGYGARALQDLGFATTSWWPGFGAVLELIADALSKNQPTLASTNATIVGGAPVVESHVYAVIRVDLTARTMTLYNPWGVDGLGMDADPNDGCVTITEAQLIGNFSSVDTGVAFQFSAAPAVVPAPVTLPLAPMTAAASYDGRVMHITWSAIAGADGVSVYRTEPGVDELPMRVCAYPGTATTVDDVTTTAGKTYLYTIYGTLGGLKGGAASIQVTATVTPSDRQRKVMSLCTQIRMYDQIALNALAAGQMDSHSLRMALQKSMSLAGDQINAVNALLGTDIPVNVPLPPTPA